MTLVTCGPPARRLVVLTAVPSTLCSFSTPGAATRVRNGVKVPPVERTEEWRACANAAMDRYADGDESAFAEVYDALSPRLFGMLVRLLKGERTLSEDLLQQTFFQIHRARGSFIRGADVFPWACAIARRLFIDDRRRGRRERIAPVEDVAALLPSVCADQEGAVDAGILAERIGRALAAMPEGQRLAFELVKRDGLSMLDAAAVLGISEAAVKLRAHRAYGALRSALHDAHNDVRTRS